jgi:TBC1 domain family member 15
MNQTGMRRQLVTLKQLTQLMIPKLYTHLEKSGSDEFFFLFRQLLVWFKREFSWEDVCRLWECLWTDWLSGQFHLFIALAILDRHKEVIMGNPHPCVNPLRHIPDILRSLIPLPPFPQM